MVGALFTLQRRLLQTPLAKIDSEDMSRSQGHTSQQAGEPLTGSQDGHTTSSRSSTTDAKTKQKQQKPDTEPLQTQTGLFQRA
jgi:hypothetical protein